MQNKKLYSIMSVGIHELDEKACLAVFEVLRKSMTFILNEDKRKMEELAIRDEVMKEIAKYQPPDEAAGQIKAHGFLVEPLYFWLDPKNSFSGLSP